MLEAVSFVIIMSSSHDNPIVSRSKGLQRLQNTLTQEIAINKAMLQKYNIIYED